MCLDRPIHRTDRRPGRSTPRASAKNGRADRDYPAAGRSRDFERMTMERIARERLERVARIYKSNQEASQALGIAPGSFSRACRRYGIETPFVRQQKQRQQRHRPGPVQRSPFA
jgi:hypothetical protein